MLSIKQNHTRTYGDVYKYVAGVDTHAKKHILVLVDNQGKQFGKTQEIRVTNVQMQNAVNRIKKATDNDVLFAIDGTSSYGETLTDIVLKSGVKVIEVKPPINKSRLHGKTDEIDAFEAAKTALSTKISDSINPRIGDSQKILRVLNMKRETLNKQRTIYKNTLYAHLRTSDIDIDARGLLTDKKIKEIAMSRISGDCDDVISLCKSVAKEYARSIIKCDELLRENATLIEGKVKKICPELLELVGVGTVCASQIILSYGYKGRIKSASAFCVLAGTSPIPIFSGNSGHYRLNRKGDRQLNKALHTIALTRMRYDEATKEYVNERINQGKDKCSVRRSL